MEELDALDDAMRLIREGEETASSSSGPVPRVPALVLACRPECSEGGSSGGTDATQRKKQAVCLGCTRLYNISCCFIIATELVRWALPEGRGQWCVDCFNAWRTCHSHCTSLTLFAQWLQNFQNKTMWHAQLGAYLSLKMDGVQHITNAMIGGRIDAFRFMAGFLGTPMRRPTVVLLSDFVDPGSPWSGETLLPSMLVPLRDVDGSCVPGVMIEDSRPAPFSLELPGLDERLPLFRKLPISVEGDVSVVSAALGSMTSGSVVSS